MPDYFKGPPCGQENCREKRFYVAEDGYTYCRRGHRSEAQVIIGEDDQDGPGSRQAKRTRKVEETFVVEDPAKLEPHQAAFLYLQCFQLILWKQAHWLVHVGGYNAELEGIVKDVWTLRLESIQETMESPEEKDDQRLFSSQSRPDEKNASATTGKYRMFTNLPSIDESLAICYMATVILGTSTSLSDIRKWCLSDGFIYLQAGSGNVLPSGLFRRIPKGLRRRLQVEQGCPGTGEMARLTATFAAYLCQKPQVALPAIKDTPLLFRLMQQLALPIDVYAGFKYLAQLLGQTFDFPKRSSEHRYTADHPEVRLLSLVIIVVKLFYPFDGAPRHPRDAIEPTVQIDWRVWNEAFAQESDTRIDSEQMANERAMNINEYDVPSMSGEEIDEYLDWFQRQYIPTETDQRGTSSVAEFRQAMCDMFPLDGLPARKVDIEAEETARQDLIRARLDAVHASLIRHSPSEHKSLRPGDGYQIYRSVDDVPANALRFFQIAAKSADLSLEQVVYAVYRMDMRIQRWARDQRLRLAQKADGIVEPKSSTKIDEYEAMDLDHYAGDDSDGGHD